MNNYSPDDAAAAGALVRMPAEDAVVVSPGTTILRPYEATDRSESPLLRYWRILVKRRWVIASFVLICVVAGAALAMMTQPRYVASVSIEISREAARVVEMDEAQAQVTRDPEFYQTQYNLLRSRSLAEAVVRHLRLDRNDAFLTGFGAGDPSQLPASRQARVEMATSIVMGNTEVFPIRLSSIVQVRFKSPDPAAAATVANAIAEKFIETNLERRYEATAYARRFLQSQLAETRQRLEASERQAAAYASQNEIINIAPTTSGPQGAQGEQSLVSASLAQANTSLAEARAQRIAAESRYRQAVRQGDPIEALQNPIVSTLRDQRAQLNAQYQRQLSDFGPEYPAVRALAAQIAELDRQVATETSRVRGTVSQNLAAQYRQALAAEQQLIRLVNELKSGVIDNRRRSIQYNIFQRDVDTNRSLYDALLQRYREVGIAGSVGTNNISIVDRATVPGAPYSPNLRLNILIGLMAGLVLGALAALLLEQVDDIGVTPGEFQEKMGVPLLGTVPVAPKDEPVLDLLRDPKSAVSEAYFAVLAGLQFSTSHGTPSTLVVTSTQPGEGKSTTAMALARGLARIGKKVLLIDSDLRNPSLHKVLSLPNTAGMSNLLIGDGTVAEHARPTDLPNLTVITSGPVPPNPAELLSSDSLPRVLAAVTEQFDHVVIDAPPMLGLADGPLLARASEGTLFVAEPGRTRTSQARQALQRLRAVNAPLLGAVITKLNAKKSGYGYGYGYDYSYGQR